MRAPAIVAFGVAAAMARSSATAEPRASAPPQILFEVRSRNDEADLLQVREELRSQQVIVDPLTIAELPNEILPLTGAWDEELTLAALTAQLDGGVRAYLRGHFPLAAAQLEAALAMARRNPALVVQDATAPRWLTQALASLALTKLRLRDRAGARAALAEQIRSFPELPVTLADFGTRGEALYLEVRRELEEAPRGGLLIDVTDPDARIYVNERGRGRGGAYAADLIPGPYRVLVVVGSQSRLYRLVVHPNEQTRLQIDWREDERYQLTPRRAEIEERPPAHEPRAGTAAAGGAGPEAGAEEASLALRARLGKRLTFSDAIVIGVSEARGQRWLWGEVYERRSGRRLRRGELLRGGERRTAGRALNEDQVRFAEFLRTGKYARSFRAVRLEAMTTALAPREQGRSSPNSAASHSAAATPRGRHSPWPREARRDERRRTVRAFGALALAGAGLASVGGGIYYALETTRRPCPSCAEHGDPVWAIALVGGGALSLGLASFLAIAHQRWGQTVAHLPASISAPRERRPALTVSVDGPARAAVALVTWDF